MSEFPISSKFNDRERGVRDSKVEFLTADFALALAHDLLTLGQVKSRGWVKCDRASSRLFTLDSQAISRIAMIFPG